VYWNQRNINKTYTNDKSMITRLVKFFLLQFMHVADGDLSTKFSGAFKISLVEKY
jgi:hypothetical protein